MSTYGFVDFNAWYNTYDPDFVDINMKSNVRDSWLSFQKVLSGRFKDSPLKPINRYVEALYPMPKLLSISEDEILLQQQNHAEIQLIINNDGSFYNVDKPHIRQYYRSAENYDLPDNCFDGLYKFYMPWILDADVLVHIEQPDSSPFFIYEKEYSFKSISKDTYYFHPDFIKFHFKNVGSQMIDGNTYGKILIGSPMFNIRIKAGKDLIKEIGNMYV